MHWVYSMCEIVALLVALALCPDWPTAVSDFFSFLPFFEITELFCNISGREVKREAGCFCACGT